MSQPLLCDVAGVMSLGVFGKYHYIHSLTGYDIVDMSFLFLF